MANQDIITLRNKKTGEVVQVPRSKFVDDKGLSGIGNDMLDSLKSAPKAFGNMISSIPDAINNVGNYATSNNPIETLGNLGAGGVEQLAGLLSSPKMLSRYLAKKFPSYGKAVDQNSVALGNVGFGSLKDPTIYEALMNFEKNNGLAAQSPEEASVRNAGGLLFGGKALTTLPNMNMLTRTAALTAQQGGQGGDPVHAAILALIGEKTASSLKNGINKAANDSSNPGAAAQPLANNDASLTANIGSMPTDPSYLTTLGNIPKAALNISKSAIDVAKNIPEATTSVIKNIPETAGTAVSSGIDALSGLGATARIPAVPSMLEALSDYIKYKSVKPDTLAQRKLFSDIDPEQLPQIQERIDASKRLGLDYLTPAEATLSPFEAAKQGSFGRTSTGSKLLFEKGQQRTSSEGQAINNLLDTIHDPEELNPEMKAAYEQTMKAQVPDNFIESQTKRPVIEKAIKTLEGDAAYKQKLQEELGVELGEVKPNSFMYWDMVKRVLGDLGENAKEQGRPTTKSDIYAETRRSMVKQMDQIEPKYEIARGIAERKFTRNKIEDVFDKKSMTINNFKAILGSQKKFNDMMNKLKAYPEAQQKLKDMKLLFGQNGDMIHNDMSIRSAAGLKRTSMSDSRNKVDAMKKILDEKYGKEHDVAIIKLMTDPDWQKALTDYLAKKRK